MFQQFKISKILSLVLRLLPATGDANIQDEYYVAMKPVAACVSKVFCPPTGLIISRSKAQKYKHSLSYKPENL
jgi:RNA:NAD 2'-phosphotransferase (TPT1/KptA family)